MSLGLAKDLVSDVCNRTVLLLHVFLLELYDWEHLWCILASLDTLLGVVQGLGTSLYPGDLDLIAFLLVEVVLGVTG